MTGFLKIMRRTVPGLISITNQQLFVDLMSDNKSPHGPNGLLFVSHRSALRLQHIIKLVTMWISVMTTQHILIFNVILLEDVRKYVMLNL
jgi:hypothetical protein